MLSVVANSGCGIPHPKGDWGSPKKNPGLSRCLPSIECRLGRAVLRFLDARIILAADLGI
jgi:hypothetical protein